MAFYLEKPGTSSTPQVLIDEKKGYMKLEGMSYHENTIEFFEEIMDWLETYLDTDFRAFTFDCKMKYFNSTTKKVLFEVFDLMNESASAGKEVVVNWFVNEDDDLLRELCDDIAEDYSNMKININLTKF